jgi:outer membrane protein assembly factor BamB/tetratricopeptide (TPR) repeat protein
MSSLHRAFVVLLSLLLASLLPVLAAPPQPDTAQGLGSAPFLETAWVQPTIREDPTRKWVVSQGVKALEDRGLPVLPAFYPLGAGGKVVFRSHWGIHAVDVKTGKLLWESDSRWSIDRMVRDSLKSGPLTAWVNGYLTTGRPSVLFDNSVLASFSTDGKRVFAVEDLAVAPFIDPSGRMPMQPTMYSALGNDALTHNRLQAYDLETGKLVWELGGRGPDELGNTFFLAAPLLLDGKLHVLAEKDGNLRLVVLDPVKGGVVSTMDVAGFRTRLGVDPLRRMRAAHLAHADGILVCTTNAGLLLAIDLRTRTLAWTYPYEEGDEQPPQPLPPQQVGQPQQPQGNAPYLGFAWKVTAPVIQDGKVIYTPPDGLSVFCVDLHDGVPLWKTRAARDDLYLAGVFGDKVLIVNKKSCRALGLRDGKPVWSVETGLPSGRGVAADGVYYLPLKSAAQTSEPEVCAIDVARGQVVAHTRPRKALLPGNLLVHEGYVISQTVDEVAAYPQLRTKLAEIDELIGKDPRGPAGLTERGELKLARGDLPGAIEDLHRARDNQPSPELRTRILAKLHETLTELLQRDFDAGEKYLEEYAGLCKLPVPEGASAEDRQALETEQQRRLAELHFLEARGRERQKRPEDAVRAYLDFVAVARQEQPVAGLDDPSVRALRDVAAGGRVAALLAASAPEQRQHLEEIVARKWQALRDGGDLAAVRNFVRVFGGGSSLGREARLWLAERLLTDKAYREAELNLLALRRQDDDPLKKGQALEALARLYTDEGLLDDAVWCYRALERDFGTTAVRGDKTGAELLKEVSGDKRFLPWLEPVPPFTGKLKVREERSPFPPGPLNYTFQPAGELLPFFKKHRLSLNLNLHQFKFEDAATGQEQWAVPLTRTSFQNFLNASGAANSSPFAYHTAGHVVVLNLGHVVFALDPVQRRVLWEKNLIGPATLANYSNIVADPADGTPQLVYADGWVQRVGRVAAVTPTAFCLLLRDGLVALEPRTGATLWARSDVSVNNQVFDDGERVYLVEIDPQGKPTTTRALRLSDGVAVPVPDFAALLPGRLAAGRRNLLLSQTVAEGKLLLRLYDLPTGKDVWKRTFPAGSVVLNSLAPDFAGVLEPRGTVTLLDVRGNREVLRAPIEGVAVEKVQQVYLFEDDAHFYLAFQLRGDPMKNPEVTLPNFVPGAGVRSLRVDGPLYAFERTTGKLHWVADASRQMLVLDPARDLPVIVLSSRFQKAPAVPNGQPGVQGTAVRIIDKRTGKLIYDNSQLEGTAELHALYANPAASTVEMHGPGLKITVSAEK